MAKIRDYAVTIETAAVASMICEMPEHQTGDLLLAFVNKDTATAFTTPSGWDLIQASTSTGAAGGIYAKRATSSSETVTFTLSSETCLAVVVSVRNCYGSTVSDAISDSATGSEDSTLPLTGVGITPSYNNSLIFHWLSTDSGFGPAALPPWINIFAGDAGANSGCLSYTCQRTASAITAPDHWGASQDDSKGFIAVVRDDGNDTEVDPYIPLGTTIPTLISALVGLTGTAALVAANKGTFVTVAPMDIATIGGKTLTWVVGTVTADSGYIPFRGSTRQVATSSKTVFYGQELRFTLAPNFNLGKGIIFGTYKPYLPRDYLDLSKSSYGGLLIGFADVDNDYRFWTIGAQFSQTTHPSDRQNYAIEINTNDTDYAESGTVDLTAVNDLYLVGAGYYGALAVDMNELWLLDEIVIAGGKSSYPINFLDLDLILNYGTGPIPLFVRKGSAATIWAPIRFGGTDPININVNLRTFQFPTKADGTDYLDFHVSNNKIGVEFYGQSGDTIKITNSVFTSDSSYYWRFNSNHSASATIDFTGTSVVGAFVTLRPTVNLNEVTFIACDEIEADGAVLDYCSFKNTIGSGALKVDSSSEMDNITNCYFLNNQRAIKITAAGTYQFDNLYFEGNTYDIENASTGEVIINCINGSNPTTYINTGGGTTTINNMVTLTVRHVKTGNEPTEYVRVAIYKKSDMTMLMNEDADQTDEQTTGYYKATELYNYAGNITVIIRAREKGYLPFQTEAVITANGLDVTAVWIADPNYTP